MAKRAQSKKKPPRPPAKKRRPASGLRFRKPRLSDIVAFSVVCEPAAGGSLEEMRERLSLRTIKQYLPSREVRQGVVTRLKEMGFEVFPSHGPVVTAQGPVGLFMKAFGGRLVKRINVRAGKGSRRSRTDTWIGVQPEPRRPSRDDRRFSRQGAPPRLPKKHLFPRLPTPDVLPGALLVAVAEPPLLAGPSLPPAFPDRALHLPGDVAQLLGASATHRRSVSSGDRATGGGITVAVLDSGFARHPYYEDHEYRITRMAASDVSSDPSDDPKKHGTMIVTGLFACAPDVNVLAIKYGTNVVTALNDVRDRPEVNVVSLSWGFDLDGLKALPTDPIDMLPIQETILALIANGVTVVAAAGNGNINFPAMMPEVIAVGGVAIKANDTPKAWEGASSFRSSIFKGRDVPDVCGLASDVVVPVQPAATPNWELRAGGTSLATCQVAGIVALLLQKRSTLTPQEIRDYLMDTADDVSSGTTATGDTAVAGNDLATGAGLVNALDAWNSVP